MTDDTIEISRDAAESFSQYFGCRPSLEPGDDLEHLFFTARHVSAMYELVEELGLIEDGIFANRSSAVKHLWNRMAPTEYVGLRSYDTRALLQEFPLKHIHPVVEAYIAGVPINEGRQ